MSKRSEYACFRAICPGEQPVSFLPLNIDMQGMNVLVVGAGAVAARKIATLVEAGAAIRVVAPDVAADIEGLAAAGRIQLKQGAYENCDLHDSSLVVAATNDAALNREIAKEARLRGLLVSVASEPAEGNITFPAQLRRGSLNVAVSTNGTCPAYAAMVRDIIADVIGEEYGIVLETLAAEREKLLTAGSTYNYNIKILRARTQELLQEFVRKG